MDYEITYKEALEKAKKKKENSRNLELLNFIEDTFPELKESKDERIRKWIIGVLLTYEHDKDLRNAAVAWLEKQNSNVVNANKEYWRGYRKGKQDILYKYTTFEKQREQKELNLVEILKHYPRETELYSPLYGKLWLAEVDEENEIITCYKYPLNDGCTRAILEQENTISFYSNGTTGLPDCTISKDCMLFLYNKNQSEQKPVEWSEEDEAYMYYILVRLKQHIIDENFIECSDWLKSIKQRLKG